MEFSCQVALGIVIFENNLEERQIIHIFALPKEMVPWPRG